MHTISNLIAKHRAALQAGLVEVQNAGMRGVWNVVSCGQHLGTFSHSGSERAVKMRGLSIARRQIARWEKSLEKCQPEPVEPDAYDEAIRVWSNWR